MIRTDKIREAANLIRRLGLCKFAYTNEEGALDVSGATRVAFFGNVSPPANDGTEEFRDYVHTLTHLIEEGTVSFNDFTWTTKTDVSKRLYDLAADIEKSRATAEQLKAEAGA